MPPRVVTSRRPGLARPALLILLAGSLVIAAGCGARPVLQPAKAVDLSPAVDRVISEIDAALLRQGVTRAEVQTAAVSSPRSLDRPVSARWIHHSLTLTARPTFRHLGLQDYAAAIKEGAHRAGAIVRAASSSSGSGRLGLEVDVPVQLSGRSVVLPALTFALTPEGDRPVTGGSGSGEGEPSANLPAPGEPGRVALIIDDWGYEQPYAADFFALPVPLTMSVIPGLPASTRLARAGHDHGWEVLVHLPLQPENAALDRGPGFIRVSQSDAEIRSLARQGLGSIPYAVGINNHMGSRATQDSRVMNLVLDEVAARGFFFVDSRTSMRSVAAAVARQRGLPYGENYLFLDSKPDVGAIRRNLRLLVEAADRNGAAIGIGHVRRETLAALRAELPDLLRRGVHFVTVGSVVSPAFRYQRRPATHPPVAEPEPLTRTPAITPAPVPAPAPPSLPVPADPARPGSSEVPSSAREVPPVEVAPPPEGLPVAPEAVSSSTGTSPVAVP